MLLLLPKQALSLPRFQPLLHRISNNFAHSPYLHPPTIGARATLIIRHNNPTTTATITTTTTTCTTPQY